MEITQSYLKSCLHYNPDLGCFFWRERPIEHFKNKRAWAAWNSRFSGKLAGCLCKSTGYVRLHLNRKLHLAHTLVWIYIHGKPPAGEIDHISGRRDDNRPGNLRDVSHKENQRNMRRSKRNTSGKTGVYMHSDSGKWVSQVFAQGKVRYLGSFVSKSDAIAAREAANIKYGYHHNHGRR